MGKRTRREFLKDSAAAAIAGALYWNKPVDLFAQQSKISKVVLIRNKDLLDDHDKPRKEIVLKMLDEAVTALLDEKDAVKAWKKLVKPADVVGIKSNEWQPICTPPILEEVIKQRIQGCRCDGVKHRN